MDEQRMTKADMAREWIAKEIRIGNFARGSVLPPERELAVQIGVSYMTLRKAVSALVQEGILERNHGSGTFVCNEIPEQKVQKILGLVQPAWRRRRPSIPSCTSPRPAKRPTGCSKSSMREAGRTVRCSISGRTATHLP